MHNIIRIFLSDWNRLRRNVVAMVILIGLIVIPALYSWFNILSNWDPYGTTATSQMSISVYSEDKGYTVEGISLNVGDTIKETLEKNDIINWTFTDSSDEALENVKSGASYACLIITKDFTKNLLSFISGTPTNPVIEYYENDKKNAIATKISSKVETTIKNQINSTFVSTLGEYLSKAGNILWGEDNLAESIKKSSLEDIDTIKDDLDSLSALLNSFKTLGESASSTIDTTETLVPSLNTAISAAKSEVSLIDGSLKIGESTSSSIKTLIDSSIDTLCSELDTLTSLASLSVSNVDKEQLQSLRDSFQSLGQTTYDLLSQYLEDDNSHLEKAKSQFDDIVYKLDTYIELAYTVSDVADDMKTTLTESCAILKSSLYEVKSTFDSIADNDIPNVISTMEEAVTKAESSLESAGGSLPEVSSDLSDLKSKVDEGTASIDDLIDYVSRLKKSLNKLSKRINALSDSEVLQNLEELLSSDPDIVTDFLKSPVRMDTVKLYDTGNYGSAMSPFYTVLAIWVGALILVALIKVKVRDVPELMDTKSHERFVGRYLLFFIVSEAQTLLCVLGNLIYIDINCAHPVLFVVASVVISFVFSLIMYSLTVALSNIGQAIAVILLVIQVAGAGGTFPVEVLPEVYRMVAKFLPFSYGLSALRESVGGTYGSTYIKDLLILLLFAAIFVAFAAVVRKLFKKTNYLIEENKDNSGVML